MCPKVLKWCVLIASIGSVCITSTIAGEYGVVPSAEPDAMKPIVSEDGPRMLSFYYGYSSEVDFDDESGSYAMHTAKLQSPVAGHAGDKFSWGVNAFLEYVNFDVNDQPILEDYDLYRVGFDLSFLWSQVNGSKWSPLIRLTPSVASDFESVTSDDVRLTAFVGSFYQQRSNLKWLFGVYYTENFNDHLFIPALGFSWQPTDRIDITALGPRIDFSYRPNDDWRLGLFASAYSGSWNVEGDSGSESLEVNSMRTGVRVDYQMRKDFWVVLETGVTMLNAVELLDDHDNEIFDDDADGGLFVKLGLRYRF